MILATTNLQHDTDQLASKTGPQIALKSLELILK